MNSFRTHRFSVLRRRRFWGSRSGKGLVWLAFALPALIGLVGLTLDGGRLYLTRQRAVNVCDAAVLSTAYRLLGASTDTAAVRTDVLAAVATNNANGDSEFHVTVSDAALGANPDIILAQFNDTPATNSALTAAIEWRYDDGTAVDPDNAPTFAPEFGRGLLVRGHTSSRATFMALLGFGATAIGGAATVISDCAGSIPGGPHLVPIWITGDFTPGQQVNLALNNGNSPIPSGSYGFLSPATFEPYNTNDSVFQNWLQFGTPNAFTLRVYTSGPIQVGTPGVVRANTGWSWGQIQHSIEQATGNQVSQDPGAYGARMQRAATLYPGDEPSGGACGAPDGPPAEPTVDQGNPRIVIVPIVTYRSGNGSGATFTINAFGAFWINCLGNASTKSITANFINYTTPGGVGGPCNGVWAHQMVR